MNKVFTVGNMEVFDKGIANGTFKKKGCHDGYPGGFATNSADVAFKFIADLNKTNIWGVYELDAKWGVDTVPCEYAWWHWLINDAVVLRKVCSEPVNNVA